MNTDKALNRSLLRNSLILCLCLMTCMTLLSCKQSASISGEDSSRVVDSKNAGISNSKEISVSDSPVVSRSIAIESAIARLETFNMNLKFKRRVVVFRQMYMLFKNKFKEDNILDLPADLQELASDPELYIHSSIDLATLYHNSEPIDVSSEQARHTILLYDSADTGPDDSRVILFADGHIEITTLVPRRK